MHTFQRLTPFVILCSALCFSSSSFAISGQPVITANGPAVQYVGPLGNGRVGAVIVHGGHPIDLSTYNRAMSNSGSSVVIKDRVPVTTSRGVIDVTARSVVSSKAISRGVAIAGRALPAAGVAIGVGSLIWDLLDDNRIRPDGNGGLNYDPGTPLSERTGVCWTTAIPNSPCYPTASSAGAATASYRSAIGWNQHGPCIRTYAGTAQISEDTAISTWTESCPPNSGWDTAESGLRDTHHRQEKTQMMCPLPPASTGIPDRDGRCPTGNYDKPVSNDDVIDIIARDVTDKKDKVPLVQDILNTPGGAIDLDPGNPTTCPSRSQWSRRPSYND
jgi:hypothetical protein